MEGAPPLGPACDLPLLLAGFKGSREAPEAARLSP